jgi:putative sterol carrier protein
VLHPFPSAAWADAFKETLNANALFRQKGRDWKHGALALVVEADLSAGLEREMAILLDLDAGACRGASYLEADQARERAAFVIESNYDLWKEILQGTLDPTKALMQWKLRLTKGPLPTIIKHVPAVKEVMLSAAKVATQFGK